MLCNWLHLELPTLLRIQQISIKGGWFPSDNWIYRVMPFPNTTYGCRHWLCHCCLLRRHSDIILFPLILFAVSRFVTCIDSRHRTLKDKQSNFNRTHRIIFVWIRQCLFHKLKMCFLKYGGWPDSAAVQHKGTPIFGRVTRSRWGIRFLIPDRDSQFAELLN